MMRFANARFNFCWSCQMDLNTVAKTRRLLERLQKGESK